MPTISNTCNFVKHEIGYVKLQRKALTLLVQDPDAMLLLTYIGLTAVREETTTQFKNITLRPGQTLIRGYRSTGLSWKRYRNTLIRLAETHQLISFTTFQKGTIVTLLDNQIFDINASAEKSDPYWKNCDEGNQKGNQKGHQNSTKRAIKNPSLSSCDSGSKGDQCEVEGQSNDDEKGNQKGNQKGHQNDLVISTGKEDIRRKEINFFSARSASRPRSGDAINFSFDDKKFIGIDDADMQLWRETYPNISVERELKHATCWVLAHPHKAKKLWRRFLNGWFSRANDQAYNKQSLAAAKAGGYGKATGEYDNAF